MRWTLIAGLAAACLLCQPAGAHSDFLSRVTRADSDYNASVTHGLRSRDVRIVCHIQSATAAVCNDRVRAKWLEGGPAVWASWTDRVVQYGHRLDVIAGGVLI